MTEQHWEHHWATLVTPLYSPALTFTLAFNIKKIHWGAALRSIMFCKIALNCAAFCLSSSAHFEGKKWNNSLMLSAAAGPGQHVHQPGPGPEARHFLCAAVCKTDAHVDFEHLSDARAPSPPPCSVSACQEPPALISTSRNLGKTDVSFRSRRFTRSATLVKLVHVRTSVFVFGWRHSCAFLWWRIPQGFIFKTIWAAFHVHSIFFRWSAVGLGGYICHLYSTSVIILCMFLCIVKYLVVKMDI